MVYVCYLISVWTMFIPIIYMFHLDSHCTCERMWIKGNCVSEENPLTKAPSGIRFDILAKHAISVLCAHMSIFVIELAIVIDLAGKNSYILYRYCWSIAIPTVIQYRLRTYNYANLSCLSKDWCYVSDMMLYEHIS
jgi:hypothetical protein